jgi:hypothetical protein
MKYSLAAGLLLLASIANAQVPVWSGEPGREWHADSTSCDRRTRILAGIDSGSVFVTELAGCLKRDGWRRVLRFEVPNNCEALSVQWIDLPAGDSGFAVRPTAAIRKALQRFMPTLQDRALTRRIAFRWDSIGMVSNARIVGDTTRDDYQGQHLVSLLSLATDFGPTAYVFRRPKRATLEGLVIYRGECIREVRATDP